MRSKESSLDLVLPSSDPAWVTEIISFYAIVGCWVGCRCERGTRDYASIFVLAPMNEEIGQLVLSQPMYQIQAG
jgi:hypothetical protein